MNDNPSETFSPSETKPSATIAGSNAVGREGEQQCLDHLKQVIESEEDGVRLKLGELWHYRELLYFLTLRDIKVRYKQTLLGVTWVLIQPLLTMLIFTLVFTRFMRMNTGEMPYPLFALSGLVLWLFFANAVINSAGSLVFNAHLITKVYFPRVYIPAASIGTGLVDLAVSLLLFVAVAIYYRIAWQWSILLLPLFLLMIALLTLALGLLFSSLTVKYRDLRHSLPFVIQIWMFASPVVYPTTIVPENWGWLLFINPIAPILEGFRAALTGRAIEWPHVGIAGAIVVVLLIVSLYVFRRAEEQFAEVV